jgi:dephospho-CoA kinase
MKIIIMTGWSNSGKDTVGQYLVKKHGFKRLAFADEIKDLASELYGFPRHLADTQGGKETRWRVGYGEKTIRQILIDIALIDKRRFGNTIYADTIVKQLSSESLDTNIVITDARYLYEIDAILQFAIHVKASCRVWQTKREGQVESPVNDMSEYSLQTLVPDQILENTGTTPQNLLTQVEDELQHT